MARRSRGTVERVLIGCGGLAILGILAIVLLTFGAVLGNSDIDVEPIEEPIEDILDEDDEVDELAQVQPGVQPGVQPAGMAPNNATPLVVRVSGQQGRCCRPGRSWPRALPRKNRAGWRSSGLRRVRALGCCLEDATPEAQFPRRPINSALVEEIAAPQPLGTPSPHKQTAV